MLCSELAGLSAALQTDTGCAPALLSELHVSPLLQAAKAAGEAPYPHKFQVSHQLPAFVEQYRDAVEAGQQHSDEVSVAGSVYEKRALGGKLLFYELRSDGARVQIMADMRSAWLSFTAALWLPQQVAQSARVEHRPAEIS